MKLPAARNHIRRVTSASSVSLRSCALDALRNAIQQANAEIFAASESDEKYYGIINKNKLREAIDDIVD